MDPIIVRPIEGPLELGGTEIDCAVLEDGTRVLSRAGFVRAMGRTGKVKGGEAYLPESKLPVFLGAENLKPFITSELLANSEPINFKSLFPKMPGGVFDMWLRPGGTSGMPRNRYSERGGRRCSCA